MRPSSTNIWVPKMKANLKQINDDIERSLMQDLKFIDQLVDYIRKTPNKDWSRQQAAFINSILRTADQDIELYKKVNGIQRA